MPHEVSYLERLTL